jgi:hypothetical protein
MVTGPEAPVRRTWIEVHKCALQVARRRVAHGDAAATDGAAVIPPGLRDDDN